MLACSLRTSDYMLPGAFLGNQGSPVAKVEQLHIQQKTFEVPEAARVCKEDVRERQPAFTLSARTASIEEAYSPSQRRRTSLWTDCHWPPASTSTLTERSCSTDWQETLDACSIKQVAYDESFSS
jgi:hypothetical protein